MQAGWSTAPDNVRALGFGAGMGLPNMKKYSDEMTIDSVVGEGTTRVHDGVPRKERGRKIALCPLALSREVRERG